MRYGETADNNLVFCTVSHSHSLICRALCCVDTVAEAMSSWMRKHYDCEQVAEGEVGGSKISPDFLVCVSLSKCPQSVQRDL